MLSVLHLGLWLQLRLLPLQRRTPCGLNLTQKAALRGDIPPPPFFATCSLRWDTYVNFSLNHGISGSSLALPSCESFFHHFCLETSEPSNLQSPGRSSDHGNFSFPLKQRWLLLHLLFPFSDARLVSALSTGHPFGPAPPSGRWFCSLALSGCILTSMWAPTFPPFLLIVLKFKPRLLK